MQANRYGNRRPPANRGATGTARGAFDHLARAAQERIINGHSVQGSVCEYYPRLRVGVPCTCCSASGNSESTPDLPAPGTIAVLDPLGNASQSHIQALLQGSVVSLQRYGARGFGQGLPNDPNLDRTRNHPQHVEPATEISDLGSEIRAQVEPDVDDALDDILGSTAPGFSFSSAAASSGCGVCLGTRWVGGYSRWGGHRIVYDTQHPWATSGFVTDTSVLPHAMRQIGSPAVADLMVLLPKGASRVRALRLWNSRDLVRDYTLYLLVDGTWVPATAQLIMTHADGQLHALRIQAAAGESLVFTHLELNFDLKVSPLYIDGIKMAESEDPRLPMGYDPVNLNIAPNLSVCRVRDIVIDGTYGRVWVITSASPTADRQRRVFGWDAQARLAQEFEFTQLLRSNLALHRHTEYTNASVPDVHAENWSGHE